MNLAPVAPVIWFHLDTPSKINFHEALLSSPEATPLANYVSSWPIKLSVTLSIPNGQFEYNGNKPREYPPWQIDNLLTRFTHVILGVAHFPSAVATEGSDYEGKRLLSLLSHKNVKKVDFEFIRMDLLSPELRSLAAQKMKRVVGCLGGSKYGREHFPNLECWSTQYFENDYSYADSMPRLREIICQGIDEDIWLDRLPSSVSRMTLLDSSFDPVIPLLNPTLTHLVVQESTGDAANLLRAAPQLRSLVFLNSGLLDWNMLPKTLEYLRVEDVPRVELPHLRSLEVTQELVNDTPDGYWATMFPRLTELNVNGFITSFRHPSLKKLLVLDGVSLIECSCLEELILDGFTSLPAAPFYLLRKLEVENTNLSTFNMEMPLLEVLDLHNCKITTADFSKCPNLVELYVESNKLVSVVVDVPKVVVARFGWNSCLTNVVIKSPVKYVDLQKCPELEVIDLPTSVQQLVREGMGYPLCLDLPNLIYMDSTSIRELEHYHSLKDVVMKIFDSDNEFCPNTPGLESVTVAGCAVVDLSHTSASSVYIEGAITITLPPTIRKVMVAGIMPPQINFNGTEFLEAITGQFEQHEDEWCEKMRSNDFFVEQIGFFFDENEEINTWI